MLLFTFVGLLLLRFAARRLLSLLFQPPPRSTLDSACPCVKQPTNRPTALRLFCFAIFTLPTSDQPS